MLQLLLLEKHANMLSVVENHPCQDLSRLKTYPGKSSHALLW